MFIFESLAAVADGQCSMVTVTSVINTRPVTLTMRAGGEIVNLNAFISRQSCPYLMRYETETCLHSKLFPVYSFQQLAVYKEHIASFSQAYLRKPQWYNVLNSRTLKRTHDLATVLRCTCMQ